MKITTQSKATIGVVTVIQRRRILKNGESTYNHSTTVIWVRCDEDDLYDIQNAGPVFDELSDKAVADAKIKWPRQEIRAEEAYSIKPQRRLNARQRNAKHLGMGHFRG